MGNNAKVNPSSDQSLISPNNITFQSSIDARIKGMIDEIKITRRLISKQILPSSTKKGETTWGEKLSFVDHQLKAPWN